MAREVDVVENGARRPLSVVRRGFGIIRRETRDLWQFHFDVSDQWQTYHALVSARELDHDGNPLFVNSSRGLLIRIDSGCYTGQVFSDLTCDCRGQLNIAMRLIEAQEGIVISIPAQDGRGLGIDFKLATLTLQRETGLDTVEAARALGNCSEIDSRTYAGAIAVLKFLGVASGALIRAATNNPDKIRSFVENGYRIQEQVPVRVAPTLLTAEHMKAKREKLGHSF